MTNTTTAPPPTYIVASMRPTAVPDTSVAISDLDSASTTHPFLPDDPLASQLALLKHLPGPVYRTLRSALPHSLGSLPTNERIRVWAVRDTSCNTLRIHVFRRNVLRVVDSEPVASDAGSIPLDPMSMTRNNNATSNDSRPPPPPYSTIARGDVPLDLVRTPLTATLHRSQQITPTQNPQPSSHIVTMPASAPTLARGTPVPFSAIRLGVLAIAASPTPSLAGTTRAAFPLDTALVIDDGVDLIDNGTRPAVSRHVNAREIEVLRKWVLEDLPKAQRASGRSVESVAHPKNQGCLDCCEALCCPRYGYGSCCDNTLWACFVTDGCSHLCSIVANCFEWMFDGCGAACACCCETTGQIECDPECFCCCFALLN